MTTIRIPSPEEFAAHAGEDAPSLEDPAPFVAQLPALAEALR